MWAVDLIRVVSGHLLARFKSYPQPRDMTPEVEGWVDKILVMLYPQVDRRTILVFSKVRIDSCYGVQGTGFGGRRVTHIIGSNTYHESRNTYHRNRIRDSWTVIPM
jgi:hypothetical protein